MDRDRARASREERLDRRSRTRRHGPRRGVRRIRTLAVDAPRTSEAPTTGALLPDADRARSEA